MHRHKLADYSTLSLAPPIDRRGDGQCRSHILKYLDPQESVIDDTVALARIEVLAGSTHVQFSQNEHH